MGVSKCIWESVWEYICVRVYESVCICICLWMFACFCVSVHFFICMLCRYVCLCECMNVSSESISSICIFLCVNVFVCLCVLEFVYACVAVSACPVNECVCVCVSVCVHKNVWVLWHLGCLSLRFHQYFTRDAHGSNSLLPGVDFLDLLRPQGTSGQSWNPIWGFLGVLVQAEDSATCSLPLLKGQQRQFFRKLILETVTSE